MEEMRIGIVILLNLFFAAWPARGDEKLPLLRVGAEVFSNVTITAVTPTDIYFTYDKGMGNAKLKNLDPVLQKHFDFDAAAGAVAEAKQKAANAEYLSPGSMAINETIIIEREVDYGRCDGAGAGHRESTREASRPDAGHAGGALWTWLVPSCPTKPNFDTVDVRATQGCQYDRDPYVTSDLNPGVAFPGSEVEFNSMTKYFYVDRSLPKKKLTEGEMLDI